MRDSMQRCDANVSCGPSRQSGIVPAVLLLLRPSIKMCRCIGRCVGHSSALTSLLFALRKGGTLKPNMGGERSHPSEHGVSSGSALAMNSLTARAQTGPSWTTTQRRSGGEYGTTTSTLTSLDPWRRTAILPKPHTQFACSSSTLKKRKHHPTRGCKAYLKFNVKPQNWARGRGGVGKQAALQEGINILRAGVEFYAEN